MKSYGEKSSSSKDKKVGGCGRGGTRSVYEGGIHGGAPGGGPHWWVVSKSLAAVREMD